MTNLIDFNARIIEEFRANEGKIGGEFAGGTFLILHTTGAKTGQERLTPLAYLPDDDRMVVFAAGPGDVGTLRHPAWYHNLVAHPEVTVEVGVETVLATATVVEGTGRNEIWDAMIARVPHFAGYRNNPFREVPAVALERMPHS